MKLKLLNIEEDIKRNGWKQVTNADLPLGNKHQIGSLWDENIFGKLGSKERRSRFGYIDLKEKVFHPEAYDIIKGCSEIIPKIIAKKEKYIVKDKKLILNSNGETGIAFLIDNFKNIDFNLICKKEKTEDARYIEKNKDLILIDKFLVLPCEGLRDLDMTKKDSIRQAFSQSEINNYYKTLIYATVQLGIAEGDKELKDQIIDKIQRILIQLSDWIKTNLMKGKQGLFRGSMLRKTLDFSTRLILNSSPDIKLGQIGIPWHTLLLIYEPLVTYHIYNKDPDRVVLNKINELTKTDENSYLDHNKFNKLIQLYGKNPELCDPVLVELFKEVINEVIKDSVVIFKRDPVTSRNSWNAASVVISEGRTAVVNSSVLKPIGGDCDGDTIMILPLFSEEAKAAAREKLDLINTKSKWSDTNTFNKNIYNLDLDAVASLYNATKDI
ncbi:MAG: hypothetical protein H7836_13095 [Magnetococcus sp. YQC-3]